MTTLHDKESPFDPRTTPELTDPADFQQSVTIVDPVLHDWLVQHVLNTDT